MGKRNWFALLDGYREIKKMTEEKEKIVYRYYDPETVACYLEIQLKQLDDDIALRLKPIEEKTWQALLEQNWNNGKIIENDPATNLPIAVNPRQPSEKELATREIQELKQYLSDTDYTVIKCQELGLNYANTYPDIAVARKEARVRINELENVK